MAFCVYLLASRRHGTLYLGITSGLPGRIHQHKTKAASGFTSKSCVRQVVQKGLVMLGAGGAEPACSAAPSAPGRRQAAKARKASFLCSWR